ncbi:OLC1v1001988C1 [Oldenlandia corymbosa var. corymbosa]|uniref:OLC1v1001988C1 n=1 Tax=Oldenlandia corymbosa var. corymbosa TaxID=529605 RepID=A0AAV1DA10_OLDCO|nr:OLC1v1001988C1 [Oldenlandia corymbosa var. corymbosa]
MAEFKAHQDHRITGQTLGIINGKAYGASNVYVIRSNDNNNDHHHHHHCENPGRRYHQVVSKPAAKNTLSTCKSKSATKPWIDYRQFKRRKRIAKYKLYAYEGKVKNSFKKGIRWIKRKCRKIVHGY